MDGRIHIGNTTCADIEISSQTEVKVIMQSEDVGYSLVDLSPVSCCYIRMSPGIAYVLTVNDIISFGNILSFKVSSLRKTKEGDLRLKIHCLETGYKTTISSAKIKQMTIGRL